MANDRMPPIVKAAGLTKQVSTGATTLTILHDVSLEIDAGEAVAILGASGSGKTTLLQILGGLDRPTAGSVMIAGSDIHALAEKPRGELRNRTLGFIYQFHHLLPEFSALENVAMPLLVRREPKRVAEEQARAILGRVGLGERLVHRPQELSGGERQRAAVARALVTRPRIVLADEPTGNLDGNNAEAVFELMLELNRELGTSLIVVTHDRRLASRMDRILEIDRGNLAEKT